MDHRVFGNEFRFHTRRHTTAKLDGFLEILKPKKAIFLRAGGLVQIGEHASTSKRSGSCDEKNKYDNDSSAAGRHEGDQVARRGAQRDSILTAHALVAGVTPRHKPRDHKARSYLLPSKVPLKVPCNTRLSTQSRGTPPA